MLTTRLDDDPVDLWFPRAVYYEDLARLEEGKILEAPRCQGNPVSCFSVGQPSFTTDPARAPRAARRCDHDDENDADAGDRN